MKYLALLLLVSCAKDPITETQTDNNEFKVDLIFTHDGCKVYRFYDAGRHRYFTNCTETFSTVSCGKNCTQPESIRNN